MLKNYNQALAGLIARSNPGWKIVRRYCHDSLMSERLPRVARDDLLRLELRVEDLVVFEPEEESPASPLPFLSPKSFFWSFSNSSSFWMHMNGPWLVMLR